MEVILRNLKFKRNALLGLINKNFAVGIIQFSVVILEGTTAALEWFKKWFKKGHKIKGERDGCMFYPIFLTINDISFTQ